MTHNQILCLTFTLNYFLNIFIFKNKFSIKKYYYYVKVEILKFSKICHCKIILSFSWVKNIDYNILNVLLSIFKFITKKFTCFHYILKIMLSIIKKITTLKLLKLTTNYS